METDTSRTDTDLPFFHPKPTPARPLQGLTILAVEDSRFASEALRLLCLRSGARIRRADCLASAHRHLRTYRPSVAVVDLGLPDGSGLSLIREMVRAAHRVPVVLATSGAEREAAARTALEAGADGFLPKPVDTLAAFQSEILRHLPEDMRPQGPRPLDATVLEPDRLALREDLAHAIALLDRDAPPMGYLRRFLLGLARSAHDTLLAETATALPGTLKQGERARLKAQLVSRMAGMAAV